MGFAGYIGKYSTNLDNAKKFRMQYYTNYFDLSKPSVIKILKKISFTIIGAANAVITLKYAFDYSNNYTSRQVTIGNVVIAEYGVAEYGIGEYTSGIIFDNQRVQASGSGSILQLGIETEVNNFDLSIQKLDVFCKEGRTQ